MSDEPPGEGVREIKVDYLARVEGEGALTIRTRGREVTDVELRIFEPPRFFEAFLRGRAREEAPDITARICGICPVAYQMSSCHALEAAAGVRVDGPLRELRRLLYCGEWIESHVLHMFMLHAPDFLGVHDVGQMAVTHGAEVKLGLKVKKTGNRIVSTLGGREIHPINVKLGGFYRVPTRAELEALIPELESGLEALEEALLWMKTFPFPELERDYEFVCIRPDDEYPMNEGRVVSSKGLDIDVNEYDEHFEERHVARSNALHSVRKDGGAYHCGPLARFNLCYDALPPEAHALAQKLGVEPPVNNPYRSLLVRGVESYYALLEARRVISSYRPPADPAVPLPKVGGTGRAATEAPRGLLYHRYSVDGEGLISDAKIVPPTSQNQLVIEEDLREVAAELIDAPLDVARWRAEQTIRNYDPCISCATHFLTLRVEEEDS